jgi:arabinogalactan oligomer/maltooligosaccharide transport system permease protein
MRQELGQIDIVKYKRRRQIQITVRTVLHNLLLTVLALFWLIPIIWLIANSFSVDQGVNIRQFFPETWTLENYKALFFQPDTVANFPRWFLNTLIVALFTCFISTFFVLMAVSYTHLTLPTTPYV